jgi:hypothetical protein
VTADTSQFAVVRQHRRVAGRAERFNVRGAVDSYLDLWFDLATAGLGVQQATAHALVSGGMAGGTWARDLVRRGDAPRAVSAYSAWPMSDLADELQLRGLSTSGTAAALRRRLILDDSRQG